MNKIFFRKTFIYLFIYFASAVFKFYASIQEKNITSQKCFVCLINRLNFLILFNQSSNVRVQIQLKCDVLQTCQKDMGIREIINIILISICLLVLILFKFQSFFYGHYSSTYSVPLLMFIHFANRSVFPNTTYE